MVGSIKVSKHARRVTVRGHNLFSLLYEAENGILPGIRQYR